MTAHEIHALSGAYAVDALDDAERARFEEHLAACATCQEEVASLQEATALLAEDSATTPPPALRASVLAEIKNVRPLPPVGGAEPVADLASRRRRPRWAGLVAAAAAAAVFVGGGAVVWQQVNDSDRTQEAISPVDEVLRARDVQHVSIDFPGGASATVFKSAAENKAVLVTEKMPAAPSGRVYQLWFQKDGRMVSAGVMPAGSDQSVLLEGDLAGAEGAGITVEPKGGSTAPTSAPIAVFDFEQAT